jgi:hypothetical protein
MQPDWIELCRLFDAHRVEFLLIGGQAVIAHGYPRLTTNKKAVGRLQDLADVEALEALSEGAGPSS